MQAPHRIPITCSPEAAPHYPIVLGRGLLERTHELLDFQPPSSCILTDSNVAPHWLEPLRQSLETWGPCHSLILPPGEAAKGLEQLESIWRFLQAQGCDRKTAIFNLGGGVIGDMGGFGASTYMRGLRFVQIPTTLLSMVDASVGGKLAINFAGIKNLLGAFRQPQAVLIDLDTLSSLPPREFTSGFGEILKHGLIQDAAYFQQLRHMDAPMTPESPELLSVIQRSCELKAQVVEADEKEAGVRKILNFGHTIGHAIESLLLHTETPLLHGEAVALGLLAEADLSRAMGELQEADLGAIEAALTLHQLPTRSPQTLPWPALLEKMRGDKKNLDGELRWSLLRRVGEACFDQVVAEERVKAALRRIEALEE